MEGLLLSGWSFPSVSVPPYLGKGGWVVGGGGYWGRISISSVKFIVSLAESWSLFVVSLDSCLLSFFVSFSFLLLCGGSWVAMFSLVFLSSSSSPVLPFGRSPTFVVFPSS